MTTDRRLDPALRELLREPAMTRKDGLHRALAAIETTPQQRHRWWPFQGKNGHSSTRGFTMFSAVKFVTAAAIVALFGGFLLSAGLDTEQGEEFAPAAVTASAPPAVVVGVPHAVSGTIDWQSKAQTAEISQGEDRRMERGALIESTIEMDDPRLSGTMWRAWSFDMIGEPYERHDGEVWTGAVELVNEDGSWIGTERGYASMLPATRHRYVELTGTGAYEGLSALLYATGPYGSWTVDGFVFPGPLPEYPDPVVVPEA